MGCELGSGSEPGPQSRWFVLLRDYRGHPLIMADTEESVHLFDSYEAAAEAAGANMLGAAYGYEIYEWAT